MCKRKVTVCVSSLIFALAQSSYAAPLNLFMSTTPDIFSSFITVNYDATSDLFTASGLAMTYKPDAVTPSATIAGGSFALTATIDDAGIATAGSLSITGTVLGHGPSLLAGNLQNFGFLDAPGGEIFEFVFDNVTGDLAADYQGAPVGVILDASDTHFNGSWLNSFANSGLGVSDTGMVPEPCSLLLLTLGLPVIYRRRGRC